MARINDQPGSTARQGPVPIFVSVELSRVRWLVTWTFHGSTKMSKTFARAGDGEGVLAQLAQIGTRAERAQHLAGRSLSPRKQGWTGSGFTGFWSARAWKATSSIPPPLRFRADSADRKATRSTARHCCAF
jgi:hypothetical protein